MNNAQKPCGGLCKRYHSGICHNYCLLSKEQRIKIKVQLSKKQNPDSQGAL
ncbi:hypothetical protein [Pseudoalteromonas luteoviolacea]|uniref:hypothetical protein n=1 Tax=Pseudoalteromonas luteoviolacea TaxID=43657 RepID=UPI001B390411|nr:hypothetical protein [Pseudoalteromonas luteoviolacea]MBQ4839783.1 hypothetical protein [Pseudoalteromonas luteoviolacea]